MHRLPATHAARATCRALSLAALLAAAAWSGPAAAQQKSFACTPVDVATFPGRRVHVRCSPGDGAIQWFALGVGDSGEANRVLSVATTAVVAKRKLTIWYDPSDLAGGNIGCLTTDCRLIRGLRMY